MTFSMIETHLPNIIQNQAESGQFWLKGKPTHVNSTLIF